MASFTASGNPSSNIMVQSYKCLLVFFKMEVHGSCSPFFRNARVDMGDTSPFYFKTGRRRFSFLR